MKAIFKYGIFLLAITLALVGNAKADSVSAGGVSYTFTSGGSDGSGGFLVDLTIDTTGAMSSGTLDVFAVQFTGATNVTIASTNTGWNSIQQGNAPTCGSNSHPNFWCLQPGTGGSAISVPGNVYTFAFDVTGLSSPPTETHIQAFQGQGALAISDDVAIGAPVTAPEPSSLTMLGVGLVAVAGFFLKGLLKP